MNYKTYFLRAATGADLFSDLQGALPSLVSEDDSGDLSLDTSLACLVSEGDWWIEEPVTETQSDGTVTTVQEGTLGDHALLNVRTDDEQLQSSLEALPVADPATPLAEVADTLPRGTHRITAPSSPERRFQ